MMLRKGFASISAGGLADRPQRASQRVQRRQDGSDRRLADDSPTDVADIITASDLDLLLRAVLSRLEDCAAAAAPMVESAQVPLWDIQAICATVLECVSDLESLRRSLAHPVVSVSATDTRGCNGRGR